LFFLGGVGRGGGGGKKARKNRRQNFLHGLKKKGNLRVTGFRKDFSKKGLGRAA